MKHMRKGYEKVIHWFKRYPPIVSMATWKQIYGDAYLFKFELKEVM